MIKTVFLDMDGVITDFVGEVNKRMGIPKETIPSKWAWVEDFGYTLDQVNSWCTTEFWANLEWMPDGHDIMRLITQAFKPEQIYLLTTPMPNPESYTGKALWVQKHLPEYSKRLIVTSAPKSLFAQPDTLLFDDKDENVEGFSRAGGYGLLVPRPWNVDYGMAEYTTQIVKERLEEYPI